VRCNVEAALSNLWEDMKWEEVKNLHNYDMLEGNREVVRLLQEHYS
jgi:hypothetical protein